MAATYGSILLLLLLFKDAAAYRSWTDIVDPLTLNRSPIDLNRVAGAREKDPFNFDPEPPTSPPSQAPSIRPTYVAPTASPSKASSAPSARWENMNKGGCLEREDLYEVNMQDSFGDAWDGTTLEIYRPKSTENEVVVQSVDGNKEFSSFQSLSDEPILRTRIVGGSTQFSYVCLMPSICYEVKVEGGSDNEELKWDIRKVPLGVPREERLEETLNPAVAKGGAPSSCQFSVADENEELACEVSCKNTDNGDEASELPSATPSQIPTYSPSALPSDLPSLLPSDSPSLVPSDSPSRIPTASSW